jgi:hypothetical protein
MSAYRNGEPKRPPESEPRARAPRTELIIGISLFALGVLLLVMFQMRDRKGSGRAAPTVVSDPAPSLSGPAPSVVAAPTRPESLSERQHLATTAAISLANAAMLGNRDGLARLAMAMADVITDPKASCTEYDAAYVALRRAVLGVPDAGDLGDVETQLADIEAARCTPGSDAGG